jgi:hypothetical protein
LGRLFRVVGRSAGQLSAGLGHLRLDLLDGLLGPFDLLLRHLDRVAHRPTCPFAQATVSSAEVFVRSITGAVPLLVGDEQQPGREQ